MSEPRRLDVIQARPKPQDSEQCQIVLRLNKLADEFDSVLDRLDKLDSEYKQEEETPERRHT